MEKLLILMCGIVVGFVFGMLFGQYSKNNWYYKLAKKHKLVY